MSDISEEEIEFCKVLRYSDKIDRLEKRKERKWILKMNKDKILLYILENDGQLGIWDIISYFSGVKNIEKYVLELRREKKIELRPVNVGKGYTYKYFIKYQNS